MLGTWVKRSLRYYGARHLAFAGTVALTSAILCAALMTGDSLQDGLRRGMRARLGAVRSAVFLSDGLFPSLLAERLSEAQAALLLRGQLLDSEGAVCADGAQVIGLAVSNASLNARGREILPQGDGAVRFEKPARFSVEMPLGTAKETRLVRRAVSFEDGPETLGGWLTRDFALQAASVPPVNAFLPLDTLADAVDAPGQANLLVSAQDPEALTRALSEVLTPEDAGLVLESAKGSLATIIASPESGGASPATIVKSRRVFLPRGIVSALEAAGLKPQPATFHLADAFEAGTNATPYGFVAAMTPDDALVPRDLKDDEVVLNAWLAETLGVDTNATVTLRWRRFEPGGRLVADSRVFRVRAVIPAETAALAKAAMPVFPGLEGVDSCAAWDVGLPLDEEKLKDPANEAYWKAWRETPKAFLTFAAGKACFGTAFGEAMSLRVKADEAAVRQALRALTPAELGFAVRPLLREGEAVARGSTDFKGLFVGMAFVLMISALLLSAFSLALALETRKGEMALLGALGLGRGLTVRALAAEWAVPLLIGAAAGGGFGAALAQALVWSLGRFWRDAFAGAAVAFHFSWALAVASAAVSAVLTALVLVRTVARTARTSPVELWQAAGNWHTEAGRWSRRWNAWENGVGGALAAAALALLVWGPGGAAANGVFFGAGFLLMLSLLLFIKTAATAWASRAGGSHRAEGAWRAGVCRAIGAPRRSAPVVILLAVGTFLTVGILSMKQDPAAGCDKPSSGSGGFSSIVTSAVPFDRERGLEMARRVSGAKGVVPVRVHAGDEAGCLNMNQPVRPRLIGLESRAMARARAFEPADAGGVWTPIEEPLPDGTIPALAADQSMMLYSLKAKAGAGDGTVYAYPGADGGTVRVRVVGVLPVRSGILQGSLIVDERAFASAFPDEAGYRMWLCDYAPYSLREAVDPGKRMARVSDDRAERRAAIAALRHPEPGVTIETVEERLRLLGSVESAYLDMFLVLGGLGVVLGVAGVALVILRNVEERRGEFALLSAVGLSRGTVVRLLAAEYGVMTAAGIVAGVVPALVAIQPAVRALRGALPWGAMAGIVGGLVLCAALCVVSAACAASRRFAPAVLKEEV